MISIPYFCSCPLLLSPILGFVYACESVSESPLALLYNKANQINSASEKASQIVAAKRRAETKQSHFTLPSDFQLSDKVYPLFLVVFGWNVIAMRA